MNIKIYKSLARGEINAPPSKSYAHRLLISAALARGESKISGIIDSADMQATLSCIRALGIKCEKTGDSVSLFGTEISNEHAFFDCYESGSTLRFFIPIALAFKEKATFLGTKRLISRGIGVYEEAFKKQGIKFEVNEDRIDVSGNLKPDTFYLRGDVSSQFISGLIFALPLLSGDSKIVITTPLESEAYVDITLDTVKRFGIEATRLENEIYIKGNQKYKPHNAIAEGDFSNAAFLDAFNVLGGDVSVLGLNSNTIQPDCAYKSYFEKINTIAPTLSLSSCPDIGPVCFALAALKNGARFTGTKRLAIKESDRVVSISSELEKLGGSVQIFENEATVSKIDKIRENQELYCHNDHRIAMSLACVLSTCGGTLIGCECVKKSYPNFFEDIGRLGVKWEEIK